MNDKLAYVSSGSGKATSFTQLSLVKVKVPMLDSISNNIGVGSYFERFAEVSSTKSVARANTCIHSIHFDLCIKKLKYEYKIELTESVYAY